MSLLHNEAPAPSSHSCLSEDPSRHLPHLQKEKKDINRWDYNYIINIMISVALILVFTKGENQR